MMMEVMIYPFLSRVKGLWYGGLLNLIQGFPACFVFSMPLNHHPVLKFSLHQFSAVTPKVDIFSCISHLDTLCIFNQLAVTSENKERPWETVLFFGSLLFLRRMLQCLFFPPQVVPPDVCTVNSSLTGVFFLETNACSP